MLSAQSTQDLSFLHESNDLWLSEHRFQYINSNLVFEVGTIEAILIRNFAHYRQFANVASFDEEQVPTFVRNTIVTKDPAKPDPWGITCKIVAEPTENGRSFLTWFQLRSLERRHMNFAAMFEAVCQLYISKNVQVHLTFDRLYAVPSVINTILKHQCYFTYALRANDANYPLPYMNQLMGTGAKWSVFYRPQGDIYINTKFKLGYRHTVSNYFKPVDHVSAQKSKIYAWYKTTFNYVDIFNKSFKHVYWPFVQKSIYMVHLNALLDIAVQNAWVAWTNLTQKDESVRDFISHIASDMLELGGYSKHHHSMKHLQ